MELQSLISAVTHAFLPLKGMRALFSGRPPQEQVCFVTKLWSINVYMCTCEGVNYDNFSVVHLNERERGSLDNPSGEQ